MISKVIRGSRVRYVKIPRPRLGMKIGFPGEPGLWTVVAIEWIQQAA